MSDTIQVPHWSLERPYRFRNGPHWPEPVATLDATRALRVYSTATPSRICGDPVLSGWSYSREGTRPLGYRVSTVFEPFGGLEKAIATCAPCEANVWTDPTGNMGGCAGTVAADPDDLQPSLVKAIESQSLQRDVAEAFLPTNPMWYGFWVASPLNPKQCELLLKILTGLYLPGPDDQQIILALKAAIEQQLPLHVMMTPLGHTDFGFCTTFPHCPRCKAFSGERWGNHQQTPKTCDVCGNSYIPAETASSEEDDFKDPFFGDIFTDEEIAEIVKTSPAPSDPFARLFGEGSKKDA